jgi:hypothetical protein
MPHLKLKKYAFRNKVVENLANNWVYMGMPCYD